MDGKKLSVWLSAADENDSEDLCVTMFFGSDSKDKIRLQSAEVSLSICCDITQIALSCCIYH